MPLPRKMTSLDAIPMKQRTATIGKPWKSLVFVVLLTVVVSVSLTPGATAELESAHSSQEMSARNVDGAPSEPGEYEIEYTGHKFDRKFPGRFPDLDYGLMGYDMLKGFPLNIGHDPGFTRPIFIGDYSDGLRTADYLYLLPKGVAAVPDVSCVTSFSSEVVKSSRALSRSMSASAKISGGGWGVKFSASVGYREASAAVSSGEYVLIISKANCDYYLMKLMEDDAPPFHPAFMKWIIKLSNTNDDGDYIDFFEKYGTHFVNKVVYGASYTYEHKMSASSYETMSSSGLDVSVAASYSGLFSIGGEVGYSQAQKQAAADFNSKVTTKTITIGSPPPANGDALTWASTVKQNPLPVSYDLTSIEELFSETFMGPGSGMENYAIDYSKIKTKIAATKRLYCQRLQSQGLVDDCSDYISGLTLDKTKLAGTFKPYTGVKSSSDCVDLCYDLAKCDAVDFCDKCSSSDSDYHVCRVHMASGVTSGRADAKWETTIRVPDLQEAVVLAGTGVNGVERGLPSSTPATDVTSCSEQCAADEFCVAFTFCECPSMKHQCKLYSDILYSLTSTADSTLYFVSPGLTVAPKPIRVNVFTLQDNVWTGPACSSDGDCGSTNAVCQNNKCICPLKWYYSVSMDICVRICANLDDTMMGPYSEGPYEYDDYYDDVDVLNSYSRLDFTFYDVIDCASICFSNHECQSFYVRGGFECTLYDSLHLNFAPLFDAVYYQRACQ